MNLELFNKLMELPPAQDPYEWRMFLEVCGSYLKDNKIKNPIVVELGTWKDKQKRFYEQLFGAEYIGIDANDIRSTPDIVGNTRDPKTLEALKRRLRGRPINILFIDAFHSYDGVKKDFEMYSPLCSGIVAFHDIELGRYQIHPRREVWKFWDGLREKAAKGAEEYDGFLFLSIFQHIKKRQMGIGVMIKR